MQKWKGRQIQMGGKLSDKTYFKTSPPDKLTFDIDEDIKGITMRFWRGQFHVL